MHNAVYVVTPPDTKASNLYQRIQCQMGLFRNYTGVSTRYTGEHWELDTGDAFQVITAFYALLIDDSPGRWSSPICCNSSRKGNIFPEYFRQIASQPGYDLYGQSPKNREAAFLAIPDNAWITFVKFHS